MITTQGKKKKKKKKKKLMMEEINEYSLKMKYLLKT
mgnify:CR=1 FL=1